jgi:hypothetical protein
MNVDAIRRVTKKRPVRPLEFRLQDGDRFEVRHPEAVIVTDELIMTVDQDGKPAFIAPEAVVSIRRVGNTRKR